MKKVVNYFAINIAIFSGAQPYLPWQFGMILIFNIWAIPGNLYLHDQKLMSGWYLIFTYLLTAKGPSFKMLNNRNT